MHARIGAPGTVDGDALTCQSIDCLGQTPLHRDAKRLHLPADEGRAVIFEGNAVAWHSRLAVGPTFKRSAPTRVTSPSRVCRQVLDCPCNGDLIRVAGRPTSKSKWPAWPWRWPWKCFLPGRNQSCRRRA